MRNTIKIAILLIFILVDICIADDTAQNKPSEHDKIYHFQHRILPRWTHGSDGKFYEDLLKGNNDRLMAAAKKIVSEEFSKKIKIQRIAESNSILLVFPAPVEPPECYFIIISKVKNEYRIYTYEKTHDITKAGYKGVIGKWTPEGDHHNLGARKYEDAEQFMKEINARL
jgi:hypothetical protein